MTEAAVSPGGGTTRVAYIAGVRRSGSTVIANILGQADGCVHVGELANLYVLLVIDGPCGCGAPISQCPMWRAVFERMGWTPNVTEARRMAVLLQRRFPGRFLPMLLKVPGVRRLLVPRALRPGAADTDFFARLYAAVAAVTGARVILDSSKAPGYGHLLSLRPQIDLRVIHLIRSAHTNVPAAVRRPHPVFPRSSRHDNVVVRSLVWVAWHVAVAALWSRDPHRYLRVRYEDFVAAPECELQRLADFLELPSIPVAADGSYQLQASHTIFGNDRQVREGPVLIENGSAPRRTSRAARVVIRIVGRPVLRRYYSKRAS